MKNAIFFPAIIFAGCVAADGVSSSNSIKYTSIDPWQEKVFTVVVPGSDSTPSARSRTIQVTGKFAVYHTSLPDPGMPNPFMAFSIAAIPNPVSKSISLIDAQRAFYTADKTGMSGWVDPTGVFGSTSRVRSYLEVPGENIDAAVDKFNAQFDARKIHEQYFDRNPDISSPFTLQTAAPPEYFNGPEAGVHPQPHPKLEAIDLTDNILRLDFMNSTGIYPYWGAPAPVGGPARLVIWVDLSARKIVRSTVNGAEWDVGEQFGTPKRTKQ